MQAVFSTFVGIDYGSKMAGTTAICYETKGKLELVQSVKKRDADQFIIDQIQRLKPKYVFLDAPLSLPGVYTKPDFTDYFYRQADKELKAMSPMFLGGLTARAMRLAYELKTVDIEVFEIYPAQLALQLGLKDQGYKKELQAISTLLDVLLSKLPYSLDSPPKNWHQFDSILAFYSGYRYLAGESTSYGRADEGVIYV